MPTLQPYQYAALLPLDGSILYGGYYANPETQPKIASVGGINNILMTFPAPSNHVVPQAHIDIPRLIIQTNGRSRDAFRTPSTTLMEDPSCLMEDPSVYMGGTINYDDSAEIGLAQSTSDKPKVHI